MTDLTGRKAADFAAVVMHPDGALTTQRAMPASRRGLLLGAASLAASLPFSPAAAMLGSKGSQNSKGKTNMTSKPTIILVHGFWGGAAHWSKVIVELTKMGYGSIHAVE